MAQNSMDLFSLLPTSHNYYSGVIPSIPPIMASERLNHPPMPSVARIIQPANEDTALFILQSILKTGAHLPAGKWTTLASLGLPPKPRSLLPCLQGVDSLWALQDHQVACRSAPPPLWGV